MVVLALAACNRGAEEGEPSADATGRPTARRDTIKRKPLYPESDVLSILRELNAGEIVTSRIARDGSQNDDVLRYASVIIRDHSELMVLVDSLRLQGRDNLISGTLKREADSTTQMLATLPSGLNNTYMDQQIRAHQKALLLLDTAIIPSATTPKLRQLLVAVRPTLAAHLQRAMQIYSLRKKQAAERGEEFVVATPRTAPPRPKPSELTVTPTDTAPTPQPADTVPTTTTNM
ncbi:MAG TPA: DUF4142 domain-containing protein [Longimicrobiales bacterium]|nr:DUF4142 domain-containing protein [Longimicrobiales bacterium]